MFVKLCRQSIRRCSIFPPNILHKTKLLNKDMSSLATVPKLDIDPNGVFKYILIKIHDPKQSSEDSSITVVRGYAHCNYHSDIYDEVQAKLSPLDCEPLGGGRISHQADDKKIHIYGYSQGYGKADHSIAAKLIKNEMPGYTITISDEGY